MTRPAEILCGCLALLTIAACASYLAEDVAAIEVVHENVSVMAQDGRVVDVRIFYKAEVCAACPLILFSHGANATYDRYDVLVEAWAKEGYVVAAPLHVDSEAHPRRTDYSREDHLPTRVEDVSATLEYLTGDDFVPLEGIHLSGDYIAAGHSFGALVAQIGGGASVRGQTTRATQPPVAIIAISPPGPVAGYIEPSAWSSVSVPMLVITGTTDVVPFVAPDWQNHLKSYEMAPASLATALIFDGTDHYFNGAFGRIDAAWVPDGAVGNLNRAITAFIEQVRQGILVPDMHLLEDAPAGVQVITRANHD